MLSALINCWRHWASFTVNTYAANFQSLLSGFGNQQQTIVGLNTDIPLALIRP